MKERNVVYSGLGLILSGYKTTSKGIRYVVSSWAIRNHSNVWSVDLCSPNLLQAIIFFTIPLGSQYTTSLLIFTVITFFLGLAFGAVTQKTDSLLGSILFHAGTDTPAALGYFSNLQ
jgi:membrane protease YdiL (CAAX protease family)